MVGENTPYTTNKLSIDFRKALTHIQTGNLADDLISDDKHQFIALHLFRALDYFNNKEISSDQIVDCRQHLRKIQETLLRQKIDQSLGKYSEGFVLGTLIDALRRFDANIHKFAEFNLTIGLLRAWVEHDVSDDMSFFVEDALRSAEELLGWNETRAKALLPLGLETLKLFKIQGKNAIKEILEEIIETNEEKEVFFFLAGSLKTNPSLHAAIRSACIMDEVDSNAFLSFLEQLTMDLRSLARDKEVRGLAMLFWQGYSSTNT